MLDLKPPFDRSGQVIYLTLALTIAKRQDFSQRGAITHRFAEDLPDLQHNST